VGKGEVEFVKYSGPYGLQICLNFQYHGRKYYAFYAHMQYLYVNAGDQIDIYEPIGRTGKSGNASSLSFGEEHLHFEVRIQPNCGLGLAGRVSPLTIYGVCPLNGPIMR
jgi:murein DD-endopeptidase MepM/ murein hydrolase activator NlpD